MNIKINDDSVKTKRTLRVLFFNGKFLTNISYFIILFWNYSGVISNFTTSRCAAYINPGR